MSEEVDIRLGLKYCTSLYKLRKIVPSNRYHNNFSILNMAFEECDRPRDRPRMYSGLSANRSLSFTHATKSFSSLKW